MITKEQFQAFEEVRESGATNMFAISEVSALADLNRETVIEIMQNYDEFNELYN
ncbi:MAG TPA: hypothetical protein VF571_09130 [Pyrinomonadaceae bacterium]|jgi:hypothetical protein